MHQTHTPATSRSLLAWPNMHFRKSTDRQICLDQWLNYHAVTHSSDGELIKRSDNKELDPHVIKRQFCEGAKIDCVAYYVSYTKGAKGELVDLLHVFPGCRETCVEWCIHFFFYVCMCIAVVEDALGDVCTYCCLCTPCIYVCVYICASKHVYTSDVCAYT